MMPKILFLIGLLLLPEAALPQNSGKDAASLNTCYGAVNIFENGDFQIQFTGKSSPKGLEAYPSLADVSSENLVWLSFIAPESGDLTFNASIKTGFVQMVIFEEEKSDICGEIGSAMAEIKRIHLEKNSSLIGLDYNVRDGFLYSLTIPQGKKIQLVFATDAGSKEKLNLQWRFISGGKKEPESQIVDRRNDDFAPTFKISVQDKDTKQPIIASMSVEGNKEIAGMYVGSEFLFNIDRSSKLSVKCDVEGYFFDDRTIDALATEDQEVIVLLERVSAGKSMQIEEIEFNPGTSEITLSSEPKLKRLKDFLALNSTINVEIQGHVFAMGENSVAAQNVSEARAKRVMKYLVDNGIDKDRLSAVGYGNTKPIYPEPKFLYEEQANRRVEVVVK